MMMMTMMIYMFNCPNIGDILCIGKKCLQKYCSLSFVLYVDIRLTWTSHHYL